MGGPVPRDPGQALGTVSIITAPEASWIEQDPQRMRILLGRNLGLSKYPCMLNEQTARRETEALWYYALN